MNIYSGDVVSKDVLKSFCNLLQSGDGTSAKKLVEDLDILWASKGGNVDLSKWSKDDFSTGLIPDDIDCKYFAGKPVALTATGDGNCLYNSASLVLCGNQLRHGCLRLLVAEELYFNAEYYATHKIFKLTKERSGIPEDILFPVALSSDGDSVITNGGSEVDAVKAEAVAGCEFKKWGCLLHVMALASVIRRPIYSVYPNVAFRYRALMHNVLEPRLPPVNDDPVCLLWSRCGSLDNRPNSWYVPNHFVPLTWNSEISCETAPLEVATDAGNVSPTDRQSHVSKSTATTCSSKQGSILSFVTSSRAVPKFQKESKGKDDHCPPQKGKKRTAKCAEMDGEGNHPIKKSSAKRKFLPHWKDEFSWVVYNEEKNVMTCEICCAVPEKAGKTDFLTGSQTFKKETLVKHSVTGGHLLARDALLAKQQPLESAPIAQSFRKGKQKLEEQGRKEFAVKVNTAYLIAKEELPFSKYGPILALQEKNGLEINQTYANDKSCGTLISTIATVLTEELASEVNGKKYLSVMIDGATDASGKENETVHCRYVKDGQPANRLIGHKAVAHGHAQGLLDTVNGAFADVGIHQWKEKLVGMGADGASVNLGKKGGVVALLRRDVPHVIDFHCLPHRLELALLELQKSCVLVSTVYDVLQLIWKTYHYSPKSTRELQSIGTELGINVLKPTQVSGTRWLPHVSRALKVLITPSKDGSGQYAAVLCHMEHLSSTSKNSDIKGRAKYVCEKMKTVQFAAFCHFLADMFAIISKLSLNMQRNDLILPVAVSLIRETVTSVDSLKTRPVPNGHLQRFLGTLEKSADDQVQFQGTTLEGCLDGVHKRAAATRTGSFEATKAEAIGLCLNGLEDRFGNLLIDQTSGYEPSSNRTTDVVRDMLVFNVDAWPTNPKDLVVFGNEQIERLSHWFEPVLANAGCQVNAIPDEWLSMKLQINTSFRDKDYGSLWQTLLTKMPYRQDFQNVLHLVEILLVLPISAAQCERAISAQNRIKSSMRVNLGSATLEDLIRIAAEGPTVADFDPAQTVDKWFTRNKEAGERQRRPAFKRSSFLK